MICIKFLFSSAMATGVRFTYLSLWFLSDWSKNALFFGTFYVIVNVFSTKVLIGDTIFYISWWRRDRHFTWSSEPREGLTACSAKEVPSFLSHFKTLSNGPAPGIEPATSRSAVKRSTDWANPAAIKG